MSFNNVNKKIQIILGTIKEYNKEFKKLRRRAGNGSSQPIIPGIFLNVSLKRYNTTIILPIITAPDKKINPSDIFFEIINNLNLFFSLKLFHFKISNPVLWGRTLKINTNTLEFV